MDQETTLPPVEPVAAVASMKLEKISIESDGTKTGTTITVNGKKVDNVSSLDFDFYDSMYSPLSISYSVRDPKPSPGEFHVCTTYRLCCGGAGYPAYASKALASEKGNEPQQMTFEFVTATKDEALEAHEAKFATKTRAQWAQVK